MTWKTWTRAEARPGLSTIISAAKAEGPQVITNHGRPQVVVVDYDRYVRMCEILESSNP